MDVNELPLFDERMCRLLAVVETERRSHIRTREKNSASRLYDYCTKFNKPNGLRTLSSLAVETPRLGEMLGGAGHFSKLRHFVQLLASIKKGRTAHYWQFSPWT